MKIEKVSEHIWSLRTWMIIPIHVWVVVDDEGVTLVDAGIPSMAKGIMEFIKQLDAGPLQRIILTHGHSDHVGAVKKILAEKEVPVYVHSVEVPYMEGDLPYPRRKKAEQTVAKQIAKPLLEDEQGNLQRIGELSPFLTPGHSPGHVVYYHEKDQVLLAGDLFTSKKGKLHQPMPMFTADMKEAVKSSSIVKQLKPRRLEVCHGNSVSSPADYFDKYIETMEKKYGYNTK
ncbi:MBL fold metallo-hydrolase [Heyndrickxia sp. NPDC080065]|uniref:MBL fold metallo-hydrolase n=1 Tax=Heyndrickxia sp. NPDC080065 TaxID=3390568 RepID=UPI003CFC4001